MSDLKKTSTACDTDVTTQPVNNSRRLFLSQAVAGAMGAAAMMNILPSAIRSQAWAAGSDAPELTEVKIGFIPLTERENLICYKNQ